MYMIDIIENEKLKMKMYALQKQYKQNQKTKHNQEKILSKDTLIKACQTQYTKNS